jgi:hypothetical protein
MWAHYERHLYGSFCVATLYRILTISGRLFAPATLSTGLLSRRTPYSASMNTRTQFDASPSATGMGGQVRHGRVWNCSFIPCKPPQSDLHRMSFILQHRGGQSFHYRGPHWLFTSLSRAAEKINVVDRKRNYFFNSKSTARIHLKTDNKLSCIFP